MNNKKKFSISYAQVAPRDYQTIGKHAGLESTLLILQENSLFQPIMDNHLSATECFPVSVWGKEENKGRKLDNYWQLLMSF